MAKGRVIVIGCSAGGVAALKKLAAVLPPGLPAPVLVVMHIGHHKSILADILSKAGPLPARSAVDGEAIEDGVIYTAEPDHHLLLEAHSIRLSRSAKEHHTRPAIDPLFLSAALTHGPGTIGVVLTGRGDDGTFGLQAIKQCGGVSIVQRPHTAEEPAMPMSALRHARIDHSARLEEMGELFTRLLEEDRPSPRAIANTAALLHEYEVLLSKGNPMEHMQAIGAPSTFVCPDCHGSLWELKESAPPRFRCHVGHGFTIGSLIAAQTQDTDASIWTAIRALQERGLLLQRMSSVYDGDDPGRARELVQAARDAARHSDMLQRLVESGPNLVDESKQGVSSR